MEDQATVSSQDQPHAQLSLLTLRVCHFEAHAAGNSAKSSGLRTRTTCLPTGSTLPSQVTGTIPVLGPAQKFARTRATFAPSP